MMLDIRLAKIIEQCKSLLDHPNAIQHKEYLNNRIDKDTQERFGFGYFPGITDINLLSDIIGMTILKELGLLYENQIQDTAYPRTILFNYFESQPLIMPYKDVYGNVVAIVGRSLLTDEERELDSIEKYKNTRFTKGNHLFGLYEARKNIVEKNCVYIVEGQFDVIKAFEKGLLNVVALGSSNMTGYQLSLLCRFTDNIYLLLDNDEAGVRGRRDTVKKYSEFANIKNVYLPDEYKDLDEYLKNNDTGSIELLEVEA